MENQVEEEETAVEKFTVGDTDLFQRHRDMLKDLRRTAFLLGGISMVLLAVRCVIQPLLEATGLVLILILILILIGSPPVVDTQ